MKIKLIKGRSYTYGDSTATMLKPFIDVDDETAEKLIADGYFEKVPGEEKVSAKVLTQNVDRENPAIIKKMTMGELNTLAAELGVDLSGCKNNGDRAEVIIATLGKKKADSGEKNLEDMTDEELDAYALRLGLITSLRDKPEKIAVIQEHLKMAGAETNQINFDED